MFFSAFSSFFSWMRFAKASVIKVAKRFQVHFIHKTIKEVPFISRVPGHWNHKLFFYGTSVFLQSQKHRQVHDAWSQTHITLFFLFKEISLNTKNARTEAHFFGAIFCCRWFSSSRALKTKFTCVVFAFMVLTLLTISSHLHSHCVMK